MRFTRFLNKTGTNLFYSRYVSLHYSALYINKFTSNCLQRNLNHRHHIFQQNFLTISYLLQAFLIIPTYPMG